MYLLITLHGCDVVVIGKHPAILSLLPLDALEADFSSLVKQLKKFLWYLVERAVSYSTSSSTVGSRLQPLTMTWGRVQAQL